MIINNTCSNSISISKSTFDLYGINSGKLEDIIIALAVPDGKYGFKISAKLEDGTPIPNLILNGFVDRFGNQAETDENGMCILAVSDSNNPTLIIKDYCGIEDKTITLESKSPTLTAVDLILHKDTGYKLFRTSGTYRALAGLSYDLCAVSAGENGVAKKNGGQGGGSGGTRNFFGITLPTTFSLSATIGQSNLASTSVYIDENLLATVTQSDGGIIKQTYKNGAGRSNTIHVFEDDSLPCPGGEGGGYGSNAGGASFGGKGGNYTTGPISGENGKGPGGGGGGGELTSSGDPMVSAGKGASGGLYVRLSPSSL